VAKRVTHPNVCRTYDLFRHEATKEGESDLLVVSMEFLAGQKPRSTPERKKENSPPKKRCRS